LLKPLVSTAVLLALLQVSGCSWLHFGTQDEDAYDYRKAKPRQLPLEVPPDLSQLPRDDRYALPSSSGKPNDSNSAAGAAAPATGAVVNGASAAQTAPAGLAVVPSSASARLMRSGSERWLTVTVTPELAYSTLRDLWVGMGYKMATDDPAVGILETEWLERRPIVNEDGLRNALHRAFGAFDSTGERVRYRARFERNSDASTDITISARGMVEVLQGAFKDTSKWQIEPANPDLEVEMLQRLAQRLTASQPVAVATATTTPAGSAAPAVTTNPSVATAVPEPTPTTETAHKVTSDGVLTLQVEDTLEHVWRRVGVALDRLGFTIEDRQRDKRVYVVRYLDPDYEASEREKRSWWNRMFNSDAPVSEQQFRISLVTKANVTVIQVLDRNNRPDASPTAPRIIDQLFGQLR
jgi:outer membrane protein assembly factor BamC